MNLPHKSVLSILRDCLRTVPLMVGKENSTKIKAVRSMVISEFRSKRHLTDPKQIEVAREAAIKGISNYYIFMVKDAYLKQKEQEEHILEKLGIESDEEDK